LTKISSFENARFGVIETDRNSVPSVICGTVLSDGIFAVVEDFADVLAETCCNTFPLRPPMTGITRPPR
jgi:hypothetical protein